MSYLSFENNIIEASGSLILKSTSNDISFNNSNLLDISFIQVNNDVSCSSLFVNTIGLVNHDISFNGSNLLDVSSIQVNRINATDIYVDGSLTVINTVNLDISDNIFGLNRGHIGSKNTSGMLINYGSQSNVFFGYHNGENAFVITDTSSYHDDVSRNIVIDNFVDLKVGNTTIDGSLITNSITTSSSNNINFNNNNLTDCGQVNATSFNATSDYRTKTNIEELDKNITVSNLRPLLYLKNGKKEIGLLAHELQEVYPFMVCGEKDGKEMQSVNYNSLIGVLINDVKRLTNENQILKLNNDTLKSRLDALEEKINKTI